MQNRQNNGSWEGASRWYTGLVGDKGHYYHEHTVLPGVIRMLNLRKGDSLLDVACGNGILANRISEDINYVGIDISPTLIRSAKHGNNKEFLVGDATGNLPTIKKDFTHAVIILAIQNMKSPDKAISNVGKHLKTNGKLVIVMNHPCFRIPRQSSWETDPQNKMQFRRINRYMTPLEIPINIHPGQTNSPTTWDFHFPLSDYTRMLTKAGFVIDGMEEWVSDRESAGKAAKAENRARAEFPLFLAISAKKI